MPPIRERDRTRGIALGLLAGGVAAAFLPAIGELPLFGYLSIGLLLAGGIAAMPLLARLLLTPLQRFGRVSASADLALKRLWGAPSQAAIALGGIVASTSLMIAMAVMVWSFRGSVDSWLVQVLPADIYLRLDGDSSLDADLQRKLLADAGRGVDQFPQDGAVAPERRTAGRRAGRANHRPRQSGGDTADDRRLAVGARRRHAGLGVGAGDAALRLSRGQSRSSCRSWRGVSGKPARFFVAGIWRDYGRQQGAITMDAQDYTAITGDRTRTDGSVELEAGRFGRRK